MVQTEKDYWVVSDPHLNHANVLKFLREDGSRLRDFSSLDEMNETIISGCRDVKPNDRFYILGDVIFGPTAEYSGILRRLPGKKKLIIGNHDRIKGTPLIDFFESVELWHSFEAKKLIMTHLPLEERFFRDGLTRNVHGHLHDKVIDSPIHANVCVENTDYRPVNMDEIDAYFKGVE
jgi:calcineurin-like phosphoesterase family protein